MITSLKRTTQIVISWYRTASQPAGGICCTWLLYASSSQSPHPATSTKPSDFLTSRQISPLPLQTPSSTYSGLIHDIDSDIQTYNITFNNFRSLWLAKEVPCMVENNGEEMEDGENILKWQEALDALQ